MFSVEDDWDVLGDSSPATLARLRALMPQRTEEPARHKGDPAFALPPELVAEWVAHTLRSLRELAALRDGDRLSWPGVPEGIGWDVGGLYLAGRLVEASNSGSAYTFEQARADFLEHGPAAGGTYDPAHKWREASKYVGDQPLPYSAPADDFGSPVSGMGKADPPSENANGWQPVDLTSYLDGTHASPVATIMCRTDGVGLLYPGMTHSIHGESESGKSMIVQAEVAKLLGSGERVLYLDYEADPGSMVERLRLMGVTDAQMGLLVYVQPEVDYGARPSTEAAFESLVSGTYALAVIDGVTEALAQAPAKLRSTGGLGGNDDITVWHDHLPRVLARRTGAAVVLVDHVAKGPDAGRFALGGQAKMATMTGAAYLVRVTAPLGRGLIGEVDMYVAKDRHGYIRSKAVGEFTKDRLQLITTAIVNGTNGQLSVELRMPPAASSHDDKLHMTMELVSTYLRALPEGHPGAGVAMVKRDVSGNDQHIADALKALVARGFVEKDYRGQSSFHRSVRPFAPEFEVL